MFLEIDVSGIEEKIERCEDVNDFKAEILPLLKNEKEEWINIIKEIIKESGLSKTKFAEACGVSRGAVNKWIGGSIPKKRETFLRICTVANYDSAKSKELLQRYGKCPVLVGENEKIEFEEYNDFYFSVISFMKINYEDNKVSVSKLADSQSWSSSLRQTVSAIRQKKWCPVRNKIILLGLHFNMNKKEINELLKLADMEPLAPTNRLEATLLFILESAELNFSDKEKRNYGNDFMVEYTANVIKKLDETEMFNFLSELQKNDED